MHILSDVQKTLLFLALLAGIGIIGAVDFATDAELAFSIFYLFPVGVAAWYIGRTAGILLALESTLFWYFDNILSHTGFYSSPFFPAWDAGVRLFTFFVVTMLLVIIRQILGRESQFARIDYLTKAANGRAFSEAVEARISQLKRNQKPFSILYFDVDDFKQLNDGSGHSVGDMVLQATVAALKKVLRPEDTVARLGGDEFAVLFSETDESAARIVANRVQAALRQNPGRQFRVTYSIGVLTCLSAPRSVDDLIHEADNLMYAAKRGGKDTVKLGVCGGMEQPERAG
jgi:diguanylate cyclase (GGDEF)-like protein